MPSVPPGDARRLAAGVRAVLTDEVLAARLRKAAASRGHALPGEDDAVTAALAEYDYVTQDAAMTRYVASPCGAGPRRHPNFRQDGGWRLLQRRLR